MSDDELLLAGIAAAKAGELDRAAALLAQVVKTDPTSEQGWFWLGKCCSITGQKEYCFRRVLKINPYNMEAVQQLERLARPPIISSPTKAAKPPAFTTPSTQTPSRQPVPIMSPFVLDENPATLETPKSEEKKEPAPPPSSQPPEEKTSNEPVPNQKKTGRFLAAFLWLTIISLLICAAGIAYFYLSGKAAEWLPLSPAATWTLAQSPTQTATQQPTASPTTNASPTPAPPTSTPTAIATVVYTPVFEDAPCKFDKPQGVVVNCGYVTVPEDRTDEHSGTIRLAVAVFHSTDLHPDPDPVMFLQGGPGGEAVMLSANAYSILVKPFLSKRDYIAYDQRGTGLSKPALGCEELTSVHQQDIHGQIPASSRNLVYTNAFRSCHGSMSVGGIDLNAYTTAASAADARDVIKVLGYEQVNLYGASYGTRLAQVVMRDYPEIVRSAVLDSVVPIETKLFDTDPERYGSSLKALFDGCAADPLCAATYPDLETAFWNLVNQLDTQPIPVTAPLLTGGKITETVDGSDLVGVTLALLKTSSLIPTVPQSIYRIQQGDYSTFVAMQSSLPYEFEGIDIGLYISMMCHEHVLASTPEDLQAAMDAQHDIGIYARLPFFGNAQDVFKICELWGAVPPAPGENEPVISDIPSLIIEGKYDPATPPIFGQQVASHLSRSDYLEFPNQGHTPSAADTSGCAFEAMLTFLDDPARGADRSCLAAIKGVNFLVPYTGNPPLALSAQQGSGISYEAPAAWAKVEDGIYQRGSSPLDITQIAVLQTYFDSTELLDSLSSKLYGYQGFDAAPVQTGVRQANGLDWSLYATTSYGRPVELAMADYRGGALVVLLFCHKDERDALYQTVYLPIIDSVKPIP